MREVLLITSILQISKPWHGAIQVNQANGTELNNVWLRRLPLAFFKAVGAGCDSTGRPENSHDAAWQNHERQVTAAGEQDAVQWREVPGALHLRDSTPLAREELTPHTWGWGKAQGPLR